MAEKTLLACLVAVHCFAHTGYRRAGLALVKGDNTLEPGTITDTQLAQLRADSRLKVVVDDQNQSSAASQAHANSLAQGTVGDDLFSGSLVEAIALLDVDNADAFTSDGKPTTDALAAIVGRKVSAAERDEAWSQAQQAQADEPES